jgi:multimeric flavodoxin WrbA
MENEMKETYRGLAARTAEYLRPKKKILFLTTSNRWSGEHGGEIPKSSELAKKIAEMVGPARVEIIDIPALKIYPCEGNVSTRRGNRCGLLVAKLDDPEKNPSGCHRCWASFNNEDDELWKVSKPLLEADAVVFFGSIRWGQMNSFYQKLIERLTWIENRHSALGESDLLEKIEAGLIIVGQNWNGKGALEHQKQVLSNFGFQVKDELCWNWQFTEDDNDETLASYKKAAEDFKDIFLASLYFPFFLFSVCDTIHS